MRTTPGELLAISTSRLDTVRLLVRDTGLERPLLASLSVSVVNARSAAGSWRVSDDDSVAASPVSIAVACEMSAYTCQARRWGCESTWEDSRRRNSTIPCR